MRKTYNGQIKTFRTQSTTVWHVSEKKYIWKGFSSQRRVSSEGMDLFVQICTDFDILYQASRYFNAHIPNPPFNNCPSLRTLVWGTVKQQAARRETKRSPPFSFLLFSSLEAATSSGSSPISMRGVDHCWGWTVFIEARKWKWEDQISWAPHCLHLFRIWTKNGRRAGFSVGGVPSHAEGWQVGNLDPLFQRRQRNHRQACHRAQRCLFNFNYTLAIKACSTCFREPTSSSTWQGGESQGKCQSRPVPGCSSQVCCISCTRRCPQCSTGSRTPASSSCSWHPDHLKAFDDCHQEEGQHLDVLQPAWWGDRGDTTTTFSTSTTTPATHLLWTLWYRWTLRRLWKVRISVLWPLWLWLRTDWP